MTQQLINQHTLKDLPEIFEDSQIPVLINYFKNKQTYMNLNQKLCEEEIDFFNQRDYLLFVFNYYLALRPKEVTELMISDIDFERKVIHVPPNSNKRKKGRTLPLSEFLLEKMLFYLKLPRKNKWQKSLYLFPSRDNPHISRDRWQEIFRTALKETGLYKIPRRGGHGHFTCYTLRHTRATQLYLKTKDIIFVANFLGHTTLESTKVYIHLAETNNGYMEYMRKSMS